ncbi:MAG: hypothetical protein KDK05_07555 [Candidatus Competibacteraceae bacterium]|nr:hypothetical protein [Candidatus Competibacteraceae bacterium]
MSYVQWQMFIGPPFTRPSSDVHWDWSSLSIDTSYNPASIATTLSSGVTPQGATLNVVSTGTFPSTGGVWVGGAPRWTYIRYSGTTATTFTGCTWTGDAEEMTSKGSGSAVAFWLPVTQNNGELTFNWELDSNLATSRWEIGIGGGVQIPQSAIRNNHLVLIQWATTPGGTMNNHFLGWLSSPRYGEPGAYRKRWSASVVSAAHKVGEIIVDGVRIGELNIAKEGSASAISTVAGPYKERKSGEYTAAEPDLSPASVIDGNDNTLWISEDVIGTPLGLTVTNDPTTTEALVISQVHIAKHPGQPAGYEWVELTLCATDDIPDLALWTDTSDLINIEVGGDYNAGDKIIICSDDVLFNQQNPRSNAALVYSIEDTANSDFLSALDPAGGGLGVYTTTLGGEGWLHDVVWGTGSVPDRGASNPSNRYGPDFNGGNITAPTAGQTMRYTFANSTTPKNNWVTDFNDHAGYRYSFGDGYDEPWLLIELPAMGLMLAEDISSGHTGTTTLKDDSGPTTGGLPASGNILIGDNIIAYNNKTATTIDITSGVTDDHVTGDTVYVYFSSVASDGVPINTVRWTAGSTYFEDFDIYYSRLPEARSPGTSGYLDDYTLLASVTGHASSTYNLTFSTTRARKVVILPTLMNVDPARMRVYEVEILLDRTYYDTALWLADETPVVDLFSTLLENAYIPSGAITATDDTNHDMSDLQTERRNAWTVIADLADYTNHFVHCGRDSNFTVTANSFWTQGVSYTPDHTLTRSDIAEIEGFFDGSGVGNVSQVQLSWKSPDGAEEGTVYYPASGSQDWRGDIMEIGPYIFADSTDAAAAARKQYYLAKYPYTLYVKLATPGSYEPGEIARVQWKFDNSWGTTDRYYMITRVEESIKDLSREQSLSLIVVSREVPN